MVSNDTFNNISVISWGSVLVVEETTDLPQVTEKKADNIQLIVECICGNPIYQNINQVYSI
jgi:hypothetical protein